MTVLLIGHGYWGKKIATTLHQFKNLQLFIYDQAENKSSLDDFLTAIPNFDHVIIATPEQTHYFLTKKFLLLNKDVFVEKPLCLEEKQAQELVDLAMKNKLKLFVDYIFLYDNFAAKIKELLDSQLIGKLIKISTLRFSSFINKPDLIVSDDLMIHDLYLLRYFFKSKVFEVSFVSSSPTSNSAFEQAKFFLILADKLKVEASYSWFSPESKREYKFIGENGTIVWKKNEFSEELVLFDKKAQKTILVENKQSPLYKSIATFFSEAADSNKIYNNYIEDSRILALARTSFYENKSL